MFYNTFNEELAKLSRKRIKLADFFFTVLVAMVVVSSIRAVGILLVSALLVIPTLIALHLGKSFKQTMYLSALSAMLAVSIGIIVSFVADIPPSGSIVLLLFLGFVVTQFLRRK